MNDWEWETAEEMAENAPSDLHSEAARVFARTARLLDTDLPDSALFILDEGSGYSHDGGGWRVHLAAQGAPDDDGRIYYEVEVRGFDYVSAWREALSVFEAKIVTARGHHEAKGAASSSNPSPRHRRSMFT